MLHRVLAAILLAFLVAAPQSAHAQPAAASLTETVAAWSTFAAAVIALGGTAYSIYTVKEQIRVQNFFARRRIEEEYLTRALYVTWNCYKGALVFASAWIDCREHGHDVAAKGDYTEDQKRHRSDFVEVWQHFDREISATVAVVCSAEGDTRLLRCLKELISASAALYDYLMQSANADLIESEEALDMLPLTVDARRAAEAASMALADRLNSLYDIRAS